jgi:RNA polymerase sigma-70 factor (ECF subfamily)
MTMNGVRPKEPVSTEDLFRAHASFVARFLSRLGVFPDELDDAVQEVFLVVHRNGGYLPGPATPTGYLASIALRAASSYRRRGRKRRDRRADVTPDNVSSTGLDPARSLEVQQSLAELQGALDDLEPDLRATLVLAELEGESCNSIAATMQIAVGTVYWRLHRARKTFRQAIESRRVAERHAEGLPAGALLLGRPIKALLDTARAHPSVGFDASSALARLREALRAGVSIPPWSVGVTRAGFASGVGLTAPAILSAVVMVHSVGIGLSRWGAGKIPPARPPSGVTQASIAPELPGEAAPVGLAVAPSVTTPSVDAHPAADVAQRGVGFAPGRLQAARGTATDPAVVSPAPRRLASVPQGIVDPPTSADSLTAGDPPSPDAMREIQEVAAAQRLLASDPGQALALVRSGEARPQGYLREERRYIGIVALFKLGRVDEARAEAARFLTDYPDGPFTARVRATAR